MSSWVNFCGGKLLENPFSHGLPNFSTCMQHSLFVWIPTFCTLLFLPLLVFQANFISQRYIPLPWSKLLLTKILFCALFVADATFVLIWNIKNHQYPVDVLYPCLWIVSFFAVGVLHVVRQRSGMVTSGIQHISAIIFLVCGGPELYQRIRDQDYLHQSVSALDIAYFIWYFMLILYVLLLCFADPRSEDEKAQRCVELDSSFVNRLTLWWFTPITVIGSRKDIELDEVFELNEGSTSPYLCALWEKYWDPTLAEYRRRKGIFAQQSGDGKKVPLPSIVAVLFRIFRWEFLTASFLKLCSDTLQFANPFLLHQMIGFVSDPDAELWVGVSYAILMFVASEIRSFILNSYFYIMFRMGIKFQTLLTAAVYKKTLSLSNAARKEKTVGEIVNLMAIDVERFQTITPQIQQFWSCPYQITLALVYLYVTLGYSAAPGIILMIIFLPLNIFGSMIVKNWQAEQMKRKDQRTKMVNEVLNGMKVVKLYAWETPMEEHIDDIRQRELRLIKKSTLVRNIIDAFNTSSPFLVALFSFGTFTLSSSSHALTPQVAFVSLTLFNQLRSPMTMIAYLINQTVQAVVSNKRLKEFFTAEELDESCVEHSDVPDRSRDAAEMESLTATWDEGEGEAVTLNDIDFAAPRGGLVAVVGKVGAGKSSLLSALLGEMGKLKGRIGMHGRVAYVPQQPWIQNMTVRENITFGKSFDRKRYNQILHACALATDLKILPHGDQTEIGEKGINLSGGQKARVSLARAVYQNLDVYLLDDPLSAVDAHVGKHIYEKVIGPEGMLKNKTRILVTHGLTYLKSVEEIYVMSEGRIAECGTYDELLKQEGIFFDFVEEYKSKDEENDEDAESVVSGEETNRGYKEEEYTDLSDVEIDALNSKRDTMSNGVSLSPEKSGKVDKNKLIQKESVETGQVSLRVYHLYVKAATYWRSIAFVLFFVSYMLLSMGRSFWLSAWSDEYDNVNQTMIGMPLAWRLSVYGFIGIVESTSFCMALLMMVFAAQSASKNLHGPLLHNIFRSPMEFFDTTPLGRVLNRCAKDVEVIDSQIPINFRYLVMFLLQVVSTLTVIVISTPIFAVVILPLALIYYFFLTFYVPTSRQLKRLESINRSPIYSHFGETVQGASSIRAFDKVDVFRTASGNIVDRFIRCKYSNIVANRWLAVRLEFIGNCVIFFAAIFAALSKQFGWVDSPGLIGVSISYAMNITEVLNFAVRQLSEIEANIVAVERIDEYTNTPNEAEWVIEDKRPPSNWPSQGVVNFVGYSTRYRAGLDLVLHRVFADVGKGEKVGIVGRTGAGKSSFALALFRMIEPAEGQILIDGIDVSTIGLHDLRKNLTIIPQDPVLFFGSLRFNLDPFNASSDADIWRALDLAHLKEFASSLPGGLEYKISEGGENISVGQRQLVCLARALLRRTKVLILDEATAAVDVSTDALIQTTIREQFRDCTVLTIAHRLNTILDYDRIMVLDKGQIIEFASPSTLLADRNSTFARMLEDSQQAQQ